MRSVRFGLAVVLAEHARRRMMERSMTQALVLDIPDTGAVKQSDETHLWIYKRVDARSDNLLCVAAVVENVLVVKTVMHHWEPHP